jgi:hypothetical protein
MQVEVYEKWLEPSAVGKIRQRDRCNGNNLISFRDKLSMYIYNTQQRKNELRKWVILSRVNIIYLRLAHAPSIVNNLYFTFKRADYSENMSVLIRLSLEVDITIDIKSSEMFRRMRIMWFIWQTSIE